MLIEGVLIGALGILAAAVSFSPAAALRLFVVVARATHKSLAPLRGAKRRVWSPPPTPRVDISKVRRIEYDLGLEPWWFEGQPGFM